MADDDSTRHFQIEKHPNDTPFKCQMECDWFMNWLFIIHDFDTIRRRYCHCGLCVMKSWVWMWRCCVSFWLRHATKSEWFIRIFSSKVFCRKVSIRQPIIDRSWEMSKQPSQISTNSIVIVLFRCSSNGFTFSNKRQEENQTIDDSHWIWYFIFDVRLFRVCLSLSLSIWCFA